jgi:hypothetical protein
MHICPDCDEPLAFAFRDTSGVGAHKRGDAYNTVPDTDHYLCLPCLKAWKQRLDGPLTPDVVGDLAFFSCRVPDCGRRLAAVDEDGHELRCQEGHRYQIQPTADGGLALEPAQS